MSTGKWKLARHNFSLQDGGNLQGIFHVYRKWKLARQHSCFVAVQVQWDRTMRRVIMMEADVSDGSTPLLDTFDDIAEGQSKITIAQVKVCSGFSAASCWCTLYCSCFSAAPCWCALYSSASQRLPAGVHCTAVLLSGFLLLYIVLQLSFAFLQ